MTAPASPRRSRIWIPIVVAAAVLVVALVAIAIVVATRQSTPPVADSADGPANMASDGILLTGGSGAISVVTGPGTAAGAAPTPVDPDALDAPLHVVLYLDYRCPICNIFEQANASQLYDGVAAGDIALEIHPISILDRVSQGTAYSTRAAAAVACVADLDPRDVISVQTALFAQQPPENTPGLDDDALVALVTQASEPSSGVSDEVETCIREGRWTDWVTAATRRALDDPLPYATDGSSVQGTPTVLVNGDVYTASTVEELADPARFAAFLDAHR